MGGTIISGPRTMSLSRDQDGHRSYTVVWLVLGLSTDGPATIMNTAGLPAIGSGWSYGTEVDASAFCHPNMEIKLHREKEGDPPKVWRVQQLFSTKPLRRCQSQTIENPLLELPDISGNFSKYVEEITKDRNGDPIKSTSHESLHGPQMEFDHNRPTVRISHNIATLGLNTFASMIDTVNSSTLWGMEPRCVKLSNVSWTRKVWGVCTFYYTRTFEFEIDAGTFDRDVLDEGTKALGRWVPNADKTKPPTWQVPDGWSKSNPKHFTRYKDAHGENARILLDSTTGQPLADGEDPDTIHVEYYPESDFTTLGIPLSL